jgi:hypothetical protein
VPAGARSYFGLRFLTTVLAVFAGLVILAAMIDSSRCCGARPNHDLWRSGRQDHALPRVSPIERVMPFTVLVSTMFPLPSRSRAGSNSSFAHADVGLAIRGARIVVALFSASATSLYNPLSAVLRRIGGLRPNCSAAFPSAYEFGSGFWVRQKSDDGRALVALSRSWQEFSLPA